MGFRLDIKLCVHRARAHEAGQNIAVRSCKSPPPGLKVRRVCVLASWMGEIHTTRMNLKHITINERNQTKETTYGMITFI